MPRAFRTIQAAAGGLAILLSLSGCGGPGSPAASSNAAVPSPTAPPVDPNVAFAQYDDAAKPFECSSAYGALGDAAQQENFGLMKTKASEYHGVVATWNAKLAAIAFPVAAQPIVAEMRRLLGDESAGLKELVDIDVTNTGRVRSVRDRVNARDSAATVKGDEVRAALGHPEPQGFVAAHQLEAAYQAFYDEIAPVFDQFESALARNDLNGARAANDIEMKAAQRYLDRLDTIDFPMGYEDQVNALRGHLREIIEFDRRQVDVASAAQIVKAPDDGLPAARAADEVEAALFYKLSDLGKTLRPDRVC